MTVQNKLKKEPSELESLVNEKVELALKLGIMGEGFKPIDGYEKTNEHKRINEIDLRLWELIK
jgi:hypothetical protein